MMMTRRVVIGMVARLIGIFLFFNEVLIKYIYMILKEISVFGCLWVCQTVKGACMDERKEQR